jgi:PAS domain S-box-containing protein
VAQAHGSAVHRLKDFQLWSSAGQALLGAAGVVALTFVCYRLHLNVAMAVLGNLVGIVLLSLAGSFLAGALASLVAAFSLNYFFGSPLFTFEVDSPLDWVALGVFLITALVVSRLVSNLRQAVQRAEAANEELGSVVDAIPALVATALPDGTLDFINRRSVEFTGLSLRDAALAGSSPVHSDDLPLLVSRWRGAVATGQALETEVRVRRADGEYRWMLLRALPRHDATGKIVKWYATGTDIEDRRQAKEALRQRAGLLDLTHDTIFVRDLNDVILYWNRGATELYGWTEQEALGKTTHEVLQTVFPAPLDEIRDQLFRTGRWEGELHHTKRDGTSVIVASRWSLQRDELGLPSAILETNNDITARVQAELELRESERRYRRIFQTAGVSIWEEDFSQVAAAIDELKAQGITDFRAYFATHPEFVQHAIPLVKIIDVNDATLSLLQAQTKEELLVSLDRVFLPETQVVFAEELIAIAEGRTFFQDETVLRTLQGDPRAVLFTIAFPAPPAALDSVLVSIMDVTQRKQAEEALRRSETYLAEAQRLSHTGSFGWNVSDGRLIWSEETYRIFEYDPAELQPSVDLAFERIHPDDRPRVRQQLDSVIHDPAEWELDHRLLLPDGRIKHVHVVARPVPGPAGQLEFVGAVMDITAARRAEEELRRSEAYLAEAQRLSHTGSWARNLRHPEENYWSDEAYRIFRVNPAGDPAAINQAMRERVHPEDWPRLQQAAEQAIRNHTDFEVNYRAVLPDGSIRYIHAVGHPVTDSSGSVVELIGTVFDVTDRKRAERALRRARERTLEARFAAVLNERTRLAREIHDTLLQGFTGVALKLLAASNRVTAPAESVVALHEVVALAQKTLTDARRAVWDLRTPSPPGGNFPAAVRTAAEDCVRDTGLALDYKVSGTLQPVDPEIEAVALRVVQESITNVVKHASASIVRVQLSFETRQVRLAIADDGRGFIVDPDFGTYGGHWGLLGMRERTSQVRGKLSVRSTPGEGTEIVLLLPYLARGGSSPGYRPGEPPGDEAVPQLEASPMEEASTRH